MSKSLAFEASLLSFKQHLSHNLVSAFFIICAIGLPISLTRWFTIGNQDIFLQHIIITFIIGSFFFAKKKLHYKFLLLVIVLLLTSMIITGTMSFGLQAGSASFSAFCAGIIAIGWGARAAIVYAVAYCIFLLSCAYLFTNGHLSYLIEPNQYASIFSAWAIVAVGTALMTVLLMITANQGYSFFSQLIDEIKQQKEEMELIANTDSMTGYCCSRLCMPHLTQAIANANRDKTKVASVFVDLDNFKQINDKFGHTVGDTVLVEVAHRMRDVLREMDIPCRIGGDEFLFIIPGLHKAKELTPILQRLENVWKEPIDAQGHQLYATGSVGLAIYPDDANSADELRTKSDFEMYAAKSLKRA